MPQELPLRVLVVDDHGVVREGLVALLQRESDLDVVGSARSGTEALELVERLAPAIVVMDFKLPDMRGEVLCEQILRRRPQTRVVVLTADPTLEALRSSLAAGALTLLTKDVGIDDLPHAIRATAHGSGILSATVAHRIAEWARSAADAPHNGTGFSKQEILILSLASEGLSNREIADRLRVSQHTAKAYLRSIMRKLRVSRREEAVSAAIEKGLI